MTTATISDQTPNSKGEIQNEIGFDVDSIPALIHTARPDGYLDYFNKSFLEYLGATLDDVTGWKWRAFVHPEDVEGIVAKWRACLATGEIFEHETRLRRANGEYRWMFHRKLPLRDETGKIVKWYGSSLEIEDRKWAEEELRRSEAYLSEAQRLSHTGSFGWDVLSGEIYWSDETYRIFELEPKTEITTDLIAQRTHPDDRQAVQQLLERASSERTEFALEHRLLMPDGSIKYLRVVGRPSQDEGRRSEFVGAVTNITDQRRAEASLRRSEAYLAEAQKLSQTGSWAWSPEEGIKYWSEENYRVQSFDPRDGLPRFEELFQRIHPDDQPRLREVMESLSREQIDVETDYRIIDPGGAVRDIHTTCHPVLGPSGELFEVIGTAMDVTERKRAEEELRRGEAFLAEAQRLSHTGSFGCKFSSGEMFWSEETFAIFGYNRATTPAMDAILQRVHPEDKARVQEHMHLAASEGQGCDLEYRLLMPDDSVKHVHVVAYAAKDEPGRFEFVGAVVDVSDRKHAEEKLRASERKYRHLVDTTPAFIHTALPNGDLDFFNRGWLEYVGLPLSDLLGWGWTSMMHPEDVERIVPKWRAAVEAGEPLVGESRVRRADGEYRWFLHREEPLRNKAGEIVKWYGSSIEIEERRIAEQEIRAKEIELQQIVNLSQQHIGVFAPGGGPLYLNHAGHEYFGTTEGVADAGRHEATDPWSGSRLNLVHPEDREHFVSEREKGFLQGWPFEHEARLRRNDGQFRCFLVRFAPLKDERGDITRWIGTGTDIEDRKRAEEEIKKENIVLREEINKTSMFEEIVGVSAPLQLVLTDVSKVAPTDSTVLITGETGTG